MLSVGKLTLTTLGLLIFCNWAQGAKTQEEINKIVTEYADLKQIDIPLDNRPDSSVVAHLTSYTLHHIRYNTSLLYWTDWQYCTGRSFIAGLQVTELRSDVTENWQVTRLRFPCETIHGEYNGDIQVGNGNKPNKNKENKEPKVPARCNSFSNHIIVRYEPSTDYVRFGSPEYRCTTMMVKSVFVDCLGFGGAKFLKYERHETSNGPFIHRHFKCPPLTALCGVRAQLYKFAWDAHDCYHTGDAKDHWRPVWRPHVLDLQFACCSIVMPTEGCDADFLWQTKLTCRKGIACSVRLTSIFESVESNSNETSTSKSIAVEAGGSFTASVYGPFIAGAVAKANFKSISGRSVTDILKRTSMNATFTIVNMDGCDGSLQQLVIDCGQYRASTTHYRCLEIKEDDED